MHHSLEEQQNKLSPAASAELSERARTHKPPFCPRRTGGSAGQDRSSSATSFTGGARATQPCARLFQCSAARLCTFIYILRNIGKIWTLWTNEHFTAKDTPFYTKNSVTVWFRLKLFEHCHAGPLGLPASRILQYCPQAAQPILTMYAKFVQIDQNIVKLFFLYDSKKEGLLRYLDLNANCC